MPHTKISTQRQRHRRQRAMAMATATAMAVSGTYTVSANIGVKKTSWLLAVNLWRARLYMSPLLICVLYSRLTDGGLLKIGEMSGGLDRVAYRVDRTNLTVGQPSHRYRENIII